MKRKLSFDYPSYIYTYSLCNDQFIQTFKSIQYLHELFTCNLQHTFIHTYIHTYIHIYIHTYISSILSRVSCLKSYSYIFFKKITTNGFKQCPQIIALTSADQLATALFNFRTAFGITLKEFKRALDKA